MKKNVIIALVFAVMMLCSCTPKEQPEPTTVPANQCVATVNGEVITAEEIEYFKTRYRSDIINEYAEKYGVTDFSDFWDRSFDGKTPSQSLEESALKYAAEAKIKLVLMRENGIYDEISFAGLKAKAEKYNAEHENQQGNVGLKTVDLGSFYTYYVSTGEMELKNILAEGRLKPTDAELAKAAQEHPDLTENGLISVIVDEKYEKMIEDLIKNAVIE